MKFGKHLLIDSILGKLGSSMELLKEIAIWVQFVTFFVLKKYFLLIDMDFLIYSEY